MSAAYPAEAARLPVPRWRWSRQWALTGALVAAAAASIGQSVLFGSRDDASREVASAANEAEAVAAFLETIEPLLQEGGQVVAIGLKPGVTDVSDERYPQDVLVTMATGWMASLERIRGEIAATDPPRALADAHRLYVGALDGYVNTAAAVTAAASATDAERRAQLTELAAVLGVAADDLYDRATPRSDSRV